MKLLIQPDDGPEALLEGIRTAKKSIEIAIFRFDRAEVEAALKAAVGRGVAVSALIAYTNRGGEINLRKLEMRLLAVGVVVSRTADDLLRYHDKVMIVDRRILYVLSFNFTHLDIDHSRGFGIVTANSRFVQEASKLLRQIPNGFPINHRSIPLWSAPLMLAECSAHSSARPKRSC